MANKLKYMGGVVCESSTLDQMSGTFSAHKILDEIKVEVKSNDPLKSARDLEIIAVPLNLQVATLWKRKDLDDAGTDFVSQVVVEAVDPNGRVLGSTPLDIAIPLNKIRTRNILNVQGMKLTVSGEYCFQYREHLKGDKLSEPLAKLCFDVDLLKD